MWIIIILTLSFWNEAHAQDLLSAFDASPFSTRIELENMSAANADVENGEQDTAVHTRMANLQTSVFDDKKQSVVLGGRWQTLDFAENSKGLRDYDNVSANMTYRRNLPEQRFWSVNLNYGSASDRPFKDGRDGTVGATFLQKLNPKWMWLVNYSNNRTFLNNIPLPGFVYFQTMSKERTLILGFPFAIWITPLSKNISFRYTGLLPWSHRLRLAYVKFDQIQPYIGFEQGAQTYFDTRREERRDRTFWFERRLTGGIEGKLTQNIRYDAQSGLAFDRILYEARNFGEEKNYLINFTTAPFVSLSLKMNF